ncbi:hypothetical protein [Xanthobacter flavus]|uniref:hypothetical protein n=1 Tax=Xanthobacter flavus TaxID=281 RepID=UPI001AEA7800|nr:hypothetical protein [Xanthobacter flavus]MBP2149975.1 hypothetical protein [Xanthobacter flavus]
MQNAFQDLVPLPPADPNAASLAERLMGQSPRVTTYSPQRGGDRMEGGYASSRPGPDGQAVVRTLEDFRTGQAPYVTIAGNPALYGRSYTIPEVSYQAGGQRHVLRDVPVVVHDTGGAFRNAPEGRFDVPVGRDLGPADTNQGLSGVQFMPPQDMAYTAEPPKSAGVRAIEGAIRPVSGADPIPPRPTGILGQAPQARQGLFDDLIPDGPQQQAASGMFDDLIPNSPQPAQPSPSGPWNNITAGLNEAIYGTLGAPVDAATWLFNKAAGQVRAMTGAPVRNIEAPVGGSQWLAGVGEKVGVNDPAKVQANSTEEKLLRAAGAGVGGMIAPEAALGALGRAGVIGEGAMNTLGQIFGRSASVGDAAVNAGVGAAAGIGGQMAGQVVPEPWKPLAETVGGMAGAGVGVGAVAAGRGVAGLPQAWRDFRLSDPATQERVAGERLQQWATDPAAVRDTLDAAAASKQVGLPTEPGAVARNLVKGSEPTTFQLTGDMGLGALERASAAQNPAEFMQRRADQNTARVGALEAIQPKGAPEQVVNSLRQNLAALDQQTGQVLQSATTRAQGAAAAIGGEGAPEAYGGAIRQNIMDARAVAKERERALWQAVDPAGDLNLPATGVRDTARTIVKGLEKSAAPLEGEERAAIVTALKYPDVVPFREMTALRSRVSDAMRQEMMTNGQTRVYARLSQLRGAIERDIENAVAAKAEMEQQAVRAGTMSEEDTIAATLAKWEQDRGAWYDRRATAEMGQGVSEGGGGNASFGPGRVSPAYGTQGQSRGGPRNTEGNSGVQGSGFLPNDLQPNFDAGAADRLKIASEATKQRAQTFDSGRVGGTIQRSGAAGPFQMEASVVPGRFFVPGPRGFEAMQALRNASPGAMAQVREYAISTLRKAAQSPLDGTLDPAKVQAWRQKHTDALRAMPEVEQMLASPVAASQAMAKAAADRKAALDAFEQGAVARLLNVSDPADVTKTIGGIFSRQDAVQQMARLARETAGNEEARNGLRKGVADYINLRFIGNTEGAASGTDMMRSDAFQQFLRQNVPALKQVLSGPEIMTLQAVAADLKRSNRSLAAVKLPGGSNTTQDMNAVAKSGGAQSWLARILSPGALASAGAAAGSMTAGGIGAAAGAGGGAQLGRVIEAMRQAGLQSVDDIVRDALLNPDRARALLAQVKGEPTKGQALSLARVYMRAVSSGAPSPTAEDR